MNKNEINYFVLSIYFIFLLSLVYSSGEGFTVTSVSTSDVITNSTNLSSTYWIINTQFTGGGQAITGTITPELAKSLNTSNLEPRKAIIITAQSIDESATYDIINEGVSIYKYDLQITQGEVSCPLGVCYVASDAPACSANTNWEIQSGKSFWGKIKYRFCITKKQVGIKGAYSNPTINFNGKISLSNGDSVIEKTICSGAVQGCDGSSVNFDDIAIATWTGSLVTGDSAPNQDNFVAILNSLQGGKWQIARKSIFDSYNPLPMTADALLTQYVNSNAFQSYEDQTSGYNLITQAISPTNSAADKLLSENASFSSTPFQQDSQNTGKVVVSLSRKLTSPNVVFRIRADWIGVVIPIGIPQIIGVSSNKIASGESGKVVVNIQNIGEVQGTFAAQLVNCEPFIQLNTTQSSMKTIQPSAVDNITLDVSGGNLSTDLSQSCQVKVYEVNDPSVESFYSVNLQLEKAKVCVPGQIISNGSLIQQCSADGTAYQTIQQCENGTIPDGQGGFSCAITLDQQSTMRCNSDSDCENTKYCNQEIKVCAQRIQPIVVKCNFDSDCENTKYCNQKVKVCVQRSGCINLVNKGESSSKADIVFVGDGFLSIDELKSVVINIYDYDGTKNGMMSVEPFKSNRDKFNIWIIDGGNLGTQSVNERIGAAPDMKQAMQIAAQCTAADYQIVISKKQFRSFALFSGSAYLSFASESLFGRLFLHEFGHAFGQLRDEYVETGYGRPGVDVLPNCAGSISRASEWWGNIAGTGTFDGCEYSLGNYRSTFNSIMRAQWLLKDDYGAVNSVALLKILNKYR